MDPQQAVHEAIGGLLGEGEIAVSWVLTVDVAAADGDRYLAHHAGGGMDGHDDPETWTTLGMLRASAAVAQRQLLDYTEEDDDDATQP